MNRRSFLKIGTAATIAAVLGNQRTATAATVLPEANAGRLPLWRGFNLLEKFSFSENRPYLESDFEWIAGWGFNFVRLPLDFRCWQKAPGAEFDEKTLLEIDQGCRLGKKHGIHVNLNFHRGPGYCVNPPKEKDDLWNDPSAQKEFARQWGIFALRYRGIPSRNLSFDLINEPPDIAGAKYAAALKPAIEAIRHGDPQRLIIADGVCWGGKPANELIAFGIAQSTRGYEPMQISHYEAPWVEGSDKFPPPVWPVPAGLNCYLFGNDKPELKSPLTLQIQCPQATTLTLRADHVSNEAELVIKANGAVVFRHLLKPGPGPGDWKKSEANHWGGYNADYDRDFTATVPAGTREIQVGLERGDWMTFSSLSINGLVIQPTSRKWGEKQSVFAVEPRGLRPVDGRYACDKKTLWDQRVKPWMDLAAKGVGVHVGEWGAYNHTPHDVALAWMHDCLENWRTAGFGWALWNFRGSFGILDSDRNDVAYETFHGHKLDRKMLELLRQS